MRDPAWLEWVSTLTSEESRHCCAATFSTDSFYCLLDDLPLHLIPQGFLCSERFGEILRQPLFLNPLCSIYGDGEFPEEFAEREELVGRFARQGTTAWVRDPETQSLLPFWLGPRLESAIRSLRPNEPASLKIGDDARAWLAAAGILTAEDEPNRWRSSWENISAKGAAKFQEKGYVPLRGLIHPFHVAALRRYYRSLVRRGMVRLGDIGNPLRYVANNEGVARFFHHQLTSTVSAVAGQRVKPSYVYFASYVSGAELIKHTDRPQCEFSVTLCLDFSPEPAKETSWPIRLETPGGQVAVYQALGDGLVYRGTRVPHYRDVLPEGKTSTSIFFHYVAADFCGPLD